MTDYVTKDSGERAQFDSGMQRDTEKGKPRFDLMLAEGVPYEEQMITRFAKLLGRGAEKYDDRNWEKADSEAEMARMKSSAFRHFMQWMCGETDEDHAAGAIFNILAFETTKHKVESAEDDKDRKTRGILDLSAMQAEIEDSEPIRMFVGSVYGPPPPAPTSFVHPDEKVTSVSKPSEMVKKWQDMGYTPEEAQSLRNQQMAFAPDQEQVREQIQTHINLGVTGPAEGSVARLLEDQIATTRLRQRRAGW